MHHLCTVFLKRFALLLVPFSPPYSPKFISDFQLNLNEIAQPIADFKTFNDFFTRRAVVPHNFAHFELKMVLFLLGS